MYQKFFYFREKTKRPGYNLVGYIARETCAVWPYFMFVNFLICVICRDSPYKLPCQIWSP